jgi:hypothetical protein
MSPPDRLPDNLWADIQDVTERMAAFLAQAHQEVVAHEHRTGKVEVSFYAWLQPVVASIMELKKIDRYGPRNNVVSFPQRVRQKNIGEAR